MNELTNTITAPEVEGIGGKICLSASKLFLKGGALKRFGFRKDEITRFDSMENYVADRIEQIDEYRELFSRFTSFEGKTVLELGCNKGYLINSFFAARKLSRHRRGTRPGGIENRPRKLRR